MMNDEMRNELIDEVTEWMADDAEFSTEFLRQHGESWLVPYSLRDLHEDCYGCELADTINAFINSGCSCNDWYEYFVDDNGDLHDWDDVGDVVSEMVWDDSKYAEWCVEELEEGLITEPQELVDIFNKYAGVDWEDVDVAIGVALSKAITPADNTECNVTEFISRCREVVKFADVVDYLTSTRFCGADESLYGKIIDDICNDNLIGTIAVDADEYVNSMHVSLAKAVEIIVKNEYLEGRWF